MKAGPIKKPYLILTLMLLLYHQVYGQKIDQDHRNWLSAGIFFLGGQKPFFSSYAETVDISYHYQTGPHLFSLRGLWTGNLCFVCDDIDEFWDLSFLYGRSPTSDNSHASISGGLGIVGGDKADSFHDHRKVATTVGAALQTQFFLTVSRSIGIGIYGFANINSENQLYGATLNLQVGKLKD